jgi:tetratricopeptide (TPR) repeat protein
LSILLIAGISVYCYVNYKKTPFITFGWFWFIIALLPVSGIIQAGTQSMADRFTYIPGIGFAIMLSWGISHFSSGIKNSKVILSVLSFIILALFSAASFIQAGTWKNSESLFSHAINVTRDNEIAEVNLAGTYLIEGNISGAVTHYRETLRINPCNGVAHFNLGNIMFKSGEYENAVKEYYSALETVKENPFLHRNLASSLTKLGRTQEAEHHIQEYRRLRSSLGQQH